MHGLHIYRENKKGANFISELTVIWYCVKEYNGVFRVYHTVLKSKLVRPTTLHIYKRHVYLAFACCNELMKKFNNSEFQESQPSGL